jgi:HlyD family secretion protein
MKRRYILPILGLAGIGLAISVSFSHGRPPATTPNQLTTPPTSSFEATIAASGLIEASSRNIEIGTHSSGVIAKIEVSEGQEVKAGDILFALDDRMAQAEAKSAEARLANARAALEDEKDQLARVEQLKAGVSVSIDAQQRRRFAVKRAVAALAQVEADLHSAQTTLERLTLRAPVDGRVLKVRAAVGEFVTAGVSQPVLMGQDRPLHLRVTIDENDAWRFAPEAKATAALRSNKDISYPLTFVRVEPYVQPKRDLTGAMNERVDTRVLEVVYRFDPDDARPVYIGQQMDVFVSSEK